MKELRFTFRGNVYRINEEGHINANGMNTNDLGNYSKNWIFLGGSKHHWRNGVDINLKEAFEKPERLDGCLGWDLDHDTMRQWGGKYLGKLPRIRDAHVAEV